MQARAIKQVVRERVVPADKEMSIRNTDEQGDGTICLTVAVGETIRDALLSGGRTGTRFHEDAEFRVVVTADAEIRETIKVN